MLEFVKFAGPIMATVTFLLIFMGFSRFGRIKLFRFLICEFSFVTAVIYAFQTALSASWFSPYGLALWSVLLSLNIWTSK